MKDALKKLRDQRAKLLEAAKQKRAEERRLERQQNARRRDLIGGMTLELMESGEWPKDRILSRLDQYLNRENDRALFDFPRVRPRTPPEPIHWSRRLRLKTRYRRKHTGLLKLPYDS